jgi:hypothetical protein
VRGAAGVAREALPPRVLSKRSHLSCCGGDASGACKWQSSLNLRDERSSDSMLWLLPVGRLQRSSRSQPTSPPCSAWRSLLVRRLADQFFASPGVVALPRGLYLVELC